MIPRTLVLASLALLTACGGGNDNGIEEDRPNPIEELEFSAPLLDLENRHPKEVQAGLRAATSSFPQFGSITQSGSSLGGTGGHVTVSYDRDSGVLTGTLDRTGVAGGVGPRVLTALDENVRSFPANRKETFDWNGFARQFVVYDPEVQGLTGDYSPGTTQGTVTVEYNDTEWVAGGFWMRENGGGHDASRFPSVNNNAFTSAEFGVFVDGSIFDSSAPPPDSGTATYEGSAHGLAYSYGDGAQAVRRAYTWSKDMELRADFARNTISGCVGCEIMNPIAVLYDPVDPRFFLDETAINSDGTFAGATVRMEWDRYPDAQSSGSWGGKFLQPEDPAPGGAAGTMGIEWTDEQEDIGGHFLGYWYAAHDEGKHEE